MSNASMPRWFNPESSYWSSGDGRGLKCTAPIGRSLALTGSQQMHQGFAARTRTPLPVTARVSWYVVMCHEMLEWNWGLKFLTFGLVDTFSGKSSARKTVFKEGCLRNVPLCCHDHSKLTSKTQLICRSTGKGARTFTQKRRFHQKTSKRNKCSNNWALELGGKMSCPILSFNKHFSKTQFSKCLLLQSSYHPQEVGASSFRNHILQKTKQNKKHQPRRYLSFLSKEQTK